MIKKVLRKIIFVVIRAFRNIRYKILRKHLINKNPSIISSDCFGGIASHNLGLKFNSPTINLYFNKEGFFTFVENLEGFLNVDLTEVKDSELEYPVGRLQFNEKTVDVFFMHYKTFEQANNKWNDRRKRVDFSNIYIIYLTAFVSEEDIARFDALPYKNKMLIADKNPTNSKNVVTHDVFLKKDYKPGEILTYKSVFSLKRYMDDIDYIGFLNQV
ncbi:MAG: DUF1919 domain-containing protein [Clostridia bacterium]|nr:DUF1919 domain-containing protein [Clostridia bacterium]